MKPISSRDLTAFAQSLCQNEKSPSTVEKYTRAVEQLADYLAGREVTKAALLDYRRALLDRLKAQTVNGRLSAINAFLEFRRQPQLKLRLLKVQRSVFLDEARELSQAEYRRLLDAARRQIGRAHV